MPAFAGKLVSVRRRLIGRALAEPDLDRGANSFLNATTQRGYDSAKRKISRS
jgi:hypothetical protein